MKERQAVEPVVVVGAGPAGLTAAITLARAGVACLVLERRRELSSLPRATVVSTRSMELLRSWGLDDEVRAGGDEVEWLLWECESLAHAASGAGFTVGYPSTEQSAMVSPTAPECVPQDHLEAVLMRHLRSFPHVRIELDADVVDVTTGPDRARVTVRDATSGERRVVNTGAVVAADGAHSRVRDRLGIPVRGSGPLEEGVMVQFRARLWDVVGPHRFGIYSVTAANASGTFLPAGSGDRWLYGFQWDPERETLADYPEDLLTRRIALGAGRPDLDVRIERVGAFAFSAQLAPRWREGRVFLVGDAAHTVTPRGGTGMNTAIADGHDLGWKLAWVVKGWAATTLLDTYETERRPIVEHNFDRSLDPGGSRRPVVGELQVDLAGRITHSWLPDSRTSTLDLLGDGLTLFTAGTHRWAHAAETFDGSVPLTLRDVDAITARTIGVAAHGALLVRADGVPVALWPTDHDAARQLAAAVGSLTGAPAGSRHRDRSVVISTASSTAGTRRRGSAAHTRANRR